MRYASVEDEAKAKRAIAAELIESSRELDIVAEFVKSPAGAVVQASLERSIELWQKSGAWGPLDDEAKREQGKALRSKELLEYFRGAEEEAKRQRAEAERLTNLLEAAADQGRIPRI